jgi:hypothetical protein
MTFAEELHNSYKVLGPQCYQNCILGTDIHSAVQKF